MKTTLRSERRSALKKDLTEPTLLEMSDKRFTGHWFAMTKGRYTFSVERPELNDLTNISFDEFVSLIFERAIPPEAEEVDLSFHYVEVELDAKKICAHYVRLFRGPRISAFALHQAAA